MSDPATIQHRMEQLRLVPVIRIEDAAQAAPLGQALMDGGLPCAAGELLLCRPSLHDL